MKTHPIRVYADTSVYGGVFDDEFSNASRCFFDAVEGGIYKLCTSAIISQELLNAPENVKQLFDKFLPVSEILEIEIDAIELQQSYIQQGILTEKWYDDALHVAIASVTGCSIIVSWNFKHIVNYKKIPLFNAVNLLNGYNAISIYSPLEMINNDE